MRPAVTLASRSAILALALAAAGCNAILGNGQAVLIDSGAASDAGLASDAGDGGSGGDVETPEAAGPCVLDQSSLDDCILQ